MSLSIYQDIDVYTQKIENIENESGWVLYWCGLDNVFGAKGTSFSPNWKSTADGKPAGSRLVNVHKLIFKYKSHLWIHTEHLHFVFWMWSDSSSLVFTDLVNSRRYNQLFNKLYGSFPTSTHYKAAIKGKIHSSNQHQYLELMSATLVTSHWAWLSHLVLHQSSALLWTLPQFKVYWSI